MTFTNRFAETLVSACPERAGTSSGTRMCRQNQRRKLLILEQFGNRVFRIVSPETARKAVSGQELVRNGRMLQLLMTVLLLGLASIATATNQQFSNAEVDKLIEANEAPDGVVFELISGDSLTWTWASPMIATLRDQLRAKYPDLDIVVVSHGPEQFQLTRDQAGKQVSAINQLRGLANDGMSVHVCGTHSSWRDVPENAYLNFVDVAASAPAQINDYKKLGYTHIMLDRPEG